jgi:hypothetical protein
MSEMIDHLHSLGYEAVHPDTLLPPGYVEGIEDALKCRLPEDYLEFVREFPRTGACEGSALIPLPEEESRPELTELTWSTLLGHDLKETWGLVRVNDFYLDHKVEDMIVIGDDTIGNLFYMGVNGRPGIYFKDRQVSGIMTREEMIFVRPTFAEFILDTYLDPED